MNIQATQLGSVYPIGYSSPNAARRIEELMREEKMCLIDTRYSPRSRNPQWAREILMMKYKIRYHWLGATLGNVNYKGGPIKLANPEQGIDSLLFALERGHPIILLCQCPNYERCHRKVIVELLKQRLPEVRVVQP